MPFQELLHEKISSVYLEISKEFLIFETTTGKKFGYRAEGDCCSKSHFEHVNGLQSLFGNEVLRVVERAMPEDTRGDWETIRYYGWTLETKNGRCDIEMRNTSNGYYGGSVELFSPSGEMETDYNELTEDF